MRRGTSREAARVIGWKTATLANARSRGDGPPGWLRLSPTCVVYDLDVVEAWVRERHERVTADFEAEGVEPEVAPEPQP